VEGSWLLELTFTQEYSFEVTEKYDNTFEYDDVIPAIPIPYAGFKLPEIVADVINWLLPSGEKIKPEAGFVVVSTSIAIAVLDSFSQELCSNINFLLVEISLCT
jgi:hypothetical protein